jgi:hypothetical protein
MKIYNDIEQGAIYYCNAGYEKRNEIAAAYGKQPDLEFFRYVYENYVSNTNTYYTTADVSRLLCVQPQTVRLYIRNGILNATQSKKGTKNIYLISKYDYENYIQKRNS